MFSMSSPSFTAAAQSAWPYPQSPSSLRYPFGSHSSTPTTSSASTTPTSSSAAKTNSYGTSAASTASEQSSRAFPRVAEVRLYASQESQRVDPFPSFSTTSSLCGLEKYVIHGILRFVTFFGVTCSDTRFAFFDLDTHFDC